MATARLARFLIISACISVAVQTAAGSTESGSILDEGMKLYKAGQYSKAAFKFLDAAKKEKGKEPAAYYYLGCCYFNLKRPNDAKALFRTIISSYPASKEAALSSTMLQRIDPAPATGGSASSATDSGGAGAGKTIVMRSTSSRFSKDDSAALQKEMATLPDVVRFPFTSDPSGHMRVTAYLNDRPVEAWFDTGASAHFGKNHLKQASIPEPRGPTTDKTSGWAGEEVPVWKMSATLKIGNLTRKVPVTVEENMESTPLVGQEIIKGYQCEVDNSSHYITLRKSKTGSAAHGALDPMYDIPISTTGSGERARDFVTIQANGKQISVLIDTGASNTIFHPDDIKRLGVQIPEDAPSTLLSGVGGGVIMKQVQVRDVRLGPIRRDAFTVMVGGEGGSAIGQDFIGDKRFTIDRERKLMRFFH